MNLYEVVFQDTSDPDRDRDAIFLVRAPDFRAAVQEVLTNGPRDYCSTAPRSVYEVGSELLVWHNVPDVRILSSSLSNWMTVSSI